MPLTLAARSQRVAGVDVPPGRGALVRLGLAETDGESAGLTAWVGVGRHPGPRVSIVAAVHGFEAAATLAARELARQIDLATLKGTLLVVPIFRAGDRFAKAGTVAAPLVLPGDSAGPRRARLAFALYAEVVIAAQYVLVLGTARPGRRAVLMAEGNFDDPRVKKLALASGATAVVPVAHRPGSLLAVVSEAGRVALRLRSGGGADDSPTDVAVLVHAVRHLLATLSMMSEPVGRLAASGAHDRGSILASAAMALRTPVSGILKTPLPAGTFVQQGQVLARIEGPLESKGGHAGHALEAPETGIVLESPTSSIVRRGAVVFVVGKAAQPRGRSRTRPSRPRVDVADVEKVRAGWVENVSLPELGLSGLRAKIDTGARTSALHVSRTRVVGSGAGPSRAPILEITVASPGRARRRLVVVRAPVRDFVEVRDTSGRIERRPVIETTLQIGPLRRRIRLTLTDRGDMRCPILVGRTALGAGVVVDPAARFLLGGHEPRGTE